MSKTDFNGNVIISDFRYEKKFNLGRNKQFQTKLLDEILLNHWNEFRSCSVFSVSKVTYIIRQQSSLGWLKRLHCWWCSLLWAPAEYWVLIHQKWKKKKWKKSIRKIIAIDCCGFINKLQRQCRCQAIISTFNPHIIPKCNQTVAGFAFNKIYEHWMQWSSSKLSSDKWHYKYNTQYVLCLFQSRPCPCSVCVWKWYVQIR